MVLENDQPTADQLLDLSITLPDGSLKTYPFPPTNARGIAYLRIPPISGSNSTLVEYKACIDMQPASANTRFCVGNNFVIWNNP